MCTGMEPMMLMMAAGSVAQGIGAKRAADAQSAQMEMQAAQERDVGQAQAERILRATQKERGAARAALATSGTKLDDFALQNEQDIQQLGETDAAMAMLTGTRRSRSLETQASFTRAKGRNDLASSFVTAGAQAYGGWKGAQQAPKTVPIYENPEY